MIEKIFIKRSVEDNRLSTHLELSNKIVSRFLGISRLSTFISFPCGLDESNIKLEAMFNLIIKLWGERRTVTVRATTSLFPVLLSTKL